jgi:AhpD family alkylhydroperoxidase
VKMRASQLNGCAYCLDMHSRASLKAGEDEIRLHTLAGWRDAQYLYSEREQAALSFSEAVTLISEHHVPDDVWSAADAVFTERELAALLVQIVTINAWNRIVITSRTVVGDYPTASDVRR